MNERILISGASIAGLTLAHWLARHGFHPTVVERASAFAPEATGWTCGTKPSRSPNGWGSCRGSVNLPPMSRA